MTQSTMIRNLIDMMHFEYSSRISAPVNVMFGFHQRPDALELPLGPLKLRWVAHHIAYEKNRLFINEQPEGPFTAWVHALI
jgi:ligand-binding SRPBCC domain-containing protein